MTLWLKVWQRRRKFFQLDSSIKIKCFRWSNPQRLTALSFYSFVLLPTISITGIPNSGNESDIFATMLLRYPELVIFVTSKRCRHRRRGPKTMRRLFTGQQTAKTKRIRPRVSTLHPSLFFRLDHDAFA